MTEHLISLLLTHSQIRGQLGFMSPMTMLILPLVLGLCYCNKNHNNHKGRVINYSYTATRRYMTKPIELNSFVHRVDGWIQSLALMGEWLPRDPSPPTNYLMQHIALLNWRNINTNSCLLPPCSRFRPRPCPCS